MRKLPPLNAVRTFEAAARHVSFSRAADELHVTHGAVSRQVALLEQWFGVKLFRRTPSQVTLTEAGERYYREVTAILDRLALASMDVRQSAAPAALRVNAPPTFAMRWLISRISAFQRRRPEVELRLTTSLQPVSAADTGFDVAIRGGEDEAPGWTVVPFMTELTAPICHAELAAEVRLREPADLKALSLVTYLTEPYGWDDWFARAGVERAPDQSTLRFEQMYFALQAVQERMGIGLFPLFLVIEDLAAGRLATPFGPLGLRKRSYSAYVRADGDSGAAIGEFCGWLAEAGRETEQATRDWAQAQGWRF
jgi:LysR family glycine cleavage system transcriptional activator